MRIALMSSLIMLLFSSSIFATDSQESLNQLTGPELAVSSAIESESYEDGKLIMGVSGLTSPGYIIHVTLRTSKDLSQEDPIFFKTLVLVYSKKYEVPPYAIQMQVDIKTPIEGSFGVSTDPKTSQISVNYRPSWASNPKQSIVNMLYQVSQKASQLKTIPENVVGSSSATVEDDVVGFLSNYFSSRSNAKITVEPAWNFHFLRMQVRLRNEVVPGRNFGEIVNIECFYFVENGVSYVRFRPEGTYCTGPTWAPSESDYFSFVPKYYSYLVTYSDALSHAFSKFEKEQPK